MAEAYSRLLYRTPNLAYLVEEVPFGTAAYALDVRIAPDVQPEFFNLFNRPPPKPESTVHNAEGR